jgi:hypothetical protein
VQAKAQQQQHSQTTCINLDAVRMLRKQYSIVGPQKARLHVLDAVTTRTTSPENGCFQRHKGCRKPRKLTFETADGVPLIWPLFRLREFGIGEEIWRFQAQMQSRC